MVNIQAQAQAQIFYVLPHRTMKCFSIFLCIHLALLHTAGSVKRQLPTARPSTKKHKFDYDSDETTLPSSSASSSTSTGDIPSAHDVLKKIYLGNKLSAKDVHEMQLCDSALF